MRIQFAISLLCVTAVATLTSCLTNQAAMYPPPLPNVEAHVISGSATIRRTIASTTDRSLLEAEFQDVLHSENPGAAANVQVDHVVRLFYRTQALLNDYDAKLDTLSKQTNADGASLLTGDEYARLNSAWIMSDEYLFKARYLYTRALEIESEVGDDSQIAREERAHAALITKSFRSHVLSAPNSTARLAKQDLMRNLIQVNTEFHAYQLKHEGHPADVINRTDAFNELLKNEAIDNSSEMHRFYERNAAQLTRETERARKDAELNSELEKIVPAVQQGLKDQFEKRSPQSAGAIVADVGRHGMMNGNEFSRGVWALTYDDGPHPLYTEENLENLKTNDLKATFFWVAHNLVQFKKFVGEAKEAGMTLADHSYTHAELTKLDESGLVHEIDDSKKADIAAGYTPKFYRCPYGACGEPTSLVRHKIAENAMVSVTWNVDSLDWQDKNPSTIYQRVKRQMAIQKHGIILFHDIHPQSVVASAQLMSDFVLGQKSGEYRMVTIEQAFNELNSAEGMK